MNEVSLVIGEKIATKKSLYELVVHYEHGDADADTYQTHLYREDDVANLSLMKEDLGALALVSSEDFNDLNDVKAEVKAIETYAMIQGFPTSWANQFGDRFRERDVVYGDSGGYAKITGITLYYYNETGDKYEVEVKVGDRLLT